MSRLTNCRLLIQGDACFSGAGRFLCIRSLKALVSVQYVQYLFNAKKKILNTKFPFINKILQSRVQYVQCKTNFPTCAHARVCNYGNMYFLVRMVVLNTEHTEQIIKIINKTMDYVDFYTERFTEQSLNILNNPNNY